MFNEKVSLWPSRNNNEHIASCLPKESDLVPRQPEQITAPYMFSKPTSSRVNIKEVLIGIHHVRRIKVVQVLCIYVKYDVIIV